MIPRNCVASVVVIVKEIEWCGKTCFGAGGERYSALSARGTGHRRCRAERRVEGAKLAYALCRVAPPFAGGSKRKVQRYAQKEEFGRWLPEDRETNGSLAIR